ncbi:hypothetical protein BCV70DRAFT_198519 [Testicularia cyperi]|uniref:VanZ-like domain-containing protein n=1 Tax=Testicularia cyperi TaxID=1882483 RepID=A0A317XVD6_9BASI|nr:hypothetical protein BCV70DRAFT_198519 [Testicularia cyperi]
MPRLETSTGWRRIKSDLKAIVAPSTGSASVRFGIVKSLLLRSVRLSFIAQPANAPPVLPLRIRPAFVLLNVLDLVFLGVLGFHPKGQAWLRLNDKLLHFICFFFATALFYMIWDVDEPARTSWLWRNASLILTFATCFVVGGIGSEIVQGMLPYKVFQWGDIVANLLGSSLGLFFSYHMEKRYRARREIERLYAPLDIEDYGDLDDVDDDPDAEGQELQSTYRAGQTASSKFGAKSNSHDSSNKKKVRFGGEIWDDSVDIEAAPPATSSSSRNALKTVSSASSHRLESTAAASSSSSPAGSGGRSRPNREDLFAIDDDDDEDEDDDDEGSKANRPPPLPAEQSPWKDATN